MSIEGFSVEQDRRFDGLRTYEVAAQVIGYDRLTQYIYEDYATMQHGFGVGEFMLQILESNGYSESVCMQGAFMGAVHDIGKLGPDILAHVQSKESFSHEQRQWVRAAHTQEGAAQLMALNQLLQQPEISLGAFGALHHHDQIPLGYYETDDDTAFAWGLTHLLHVCDMLHALAYDTSRHYIQVREGRALTLLDIEQIILKNSFGDPVINNCRIEVGTVVGHYLH